MIIPATTPPAIAPTGVLCAARFWFWESDNDVVDDVDADDEDDCDEEPREDDPDPAEGGEDTVPVPWLVVVIADDEEDPADEDSADEDPDDEDSEDEDSEDDGGVNVTVCVSVVVAGVDGDVV